MNTTIADAALPHTGSRRRYRRYGPHRMRMGFRRWRRSRPFWGGLLAILGGAIMAYGPLTAFKVILTAGDTVWMGILVGVLVALFGLFLWFQPGMRHLYGVLITLLSLVSFITSDIGGFVIGMLLGITGGALGFAWVPIDPSSIKPHVWQRRARARWKERRRIEKLGRVAAREAGVDIEVPVRGVPVETPVSEVIAPKAEEAPSVQSRQSSVEPAAIEAVGEEVDRLPRVEAGVSSHDPDARQSRSQRRFPFRGRRP